MINVRHTLFLLICISVGQLFAQTQDSSKRVRVIHADLWRLERFEDKEYQYLSKDVLVQHRQTYFLCDSAIILNNKVRAVGHVRIVEGDSLQIFGDTLDYDGDALLADFQGNVVLRHRDRKLFCDQLHYDLKKRIASYQTGAVLTTDSVSLKSRKGYYYAKQEQAFFKDSVIVLMQDSMQLLADSLVYEAKQQIVKFTGPTSIVQKELAIYTDAGYYDVKNQFSSLDQYPRYKRGNQTAEAQFIKYNTKEGIITLKNNAWIRDSLKEAKGDSIYFNEKTNWVYILGNAEYIEGNRILKGEQIHFNRATQSLQVEGRSTVVENGRTINSDQLNYEASSDLGIAQGKVIVTDSIDDYSIYCDSLIYNKKIQFFRAFGQRPYISTKLDDDTLFLAADNLIAQQMQTEKDSFRILDAYGNVEMWSKKMQSVCDSVHFHGKDSVFTLYRNPILWSDSTQFKGDTVLMHLANKALKKIDLLQSAFIINESSDSLNSQLKGRIINAYFQTKKIHHVLVTGNAESIYFIQEDNKSYIGTNFIQCSKMNIQFNEQQKIHLIDFYTKPQGMMIPIQDGKKKYLEGYALYNRLKPKNFEDLFN